MNDNQCAGNAWVNVAGATSATVTGLAQGTNYYWQVRATNTAGDTEADNAVWRTFATQPGATPPAAFSKASPGNGARNQRSPVTLRWAASAGATGYQWCISTVSGSCTFASTSGTQVTVTLSSRTTYYWQVVATNGAGTTPANGGTWWSFRTK